MPKGVQKRPSSKERFWAKVDKNGPLWNGTCCWLWTGSHNGRGYGVFQHNRKKIYVHRYAYEAFVGLIAEGLEIDHLCRHHPCVNPEHLETVTRSENTRRGTAGLMLKIRQGQKTHCPQGHPYDLFNTYIYQRSGRGTERHCIACIRESTKQWKATKRKREW